ncbi:hypothetical protein SEPCBS119000_001616 [Sporothrix epigloea]|uniref:Methyltransferase type 11 domain-containing protein n=1 Tax=Sporothrix epigloea TaxID=1892477 RepID=A0ABP0DBP5_9PEZI
MSYSIKVQRYFESQLEEEHHYFDTTTEEANISNASSIRGRTPRMSSQSRLYKLHHQHQPKLVNSRQYKINQHIDQQAEELGQDVHMLLSPTSDQFPTPRGPYFLHVPLLSSSPSDMSIDYEETFEDQLSHGKKSPASLWNRPGSVITDVTGIDGVDEYHDDLTTRQSKLSDPGITRYNNVPHHTSSDMSRLTDSGPEEAFQMLLQLEIPLRSASLLANADTKACTSAATPALSNQVPLLPPVMAFMQRHQALHVPADSTPPSLDGSLTSDQLSRMSAQISTPPTPVIGVAGDNSANSVGWAGVQLQPDALALLQSLAQNEPSSVAGTSNKSKFVNDISTEDEQPALEMSENRSHPILTLSTSGLTSNTLQFSPVRQRSLADLTRLDIPSPGGFMLDLSPQTRRMWQMPSLAPIETVYPPTTSTAERFYKLPWANENVSPVHRSKRRPLHMPGADLSDLAVERIVEVPPVNFKDPITAFCAQQIPLTARLVVPEEPLSARLETVDKLNEFAVSAELEGFIEKVVSTEIVDGGTDIEIQQLQQTTVGQLDRTEKWLYAQRAYLVGIPDLTVAVDEILSHAATDGDMVPDVPPKDEIITASSSAVLRRQAPPLHEIVPSSTVLCTLSSKMSRKESAYYCAFTEYLTRERVTDSFINRLPRFENLQSHRLLFREAHRNQLLGKHQLKILPQSAKKRRNTNVVHGDDDLLDDLDKIRTEEKFEAFNHMAVTTWNVAAQRLLNGGRLVSTPIDKLLTHASRMTPGPGGVIHDRPSVLDLGGQATCDWAWHVAVQYPNIEVCSVTTEAFRQLSSTNLCGPSNHRQVSIEKLTCLPFDDGQFDLVRASELYSILKSVGENGENEWTACLNECYRVLKPGGYFEFTVLDSDIVNAGPLANAKSVEFGFALQTLGYDPTPTKTFLDRLGRAHFVDVKRMWMCLPVGPRPEYLTKLTASHTLNDAVERGSTDHIAAVTGLVGSLSWERWLLRAEMEKTAGEWRLADSNIANAAISEAGKSLDGVHAIVEEGRITGAAWRMLRGHARKPVLSK